MQKAVLITLAFFLFFSLAFLFINSETGKFFNSNDYFFHFYKAQGKCFEEHYSEETCESYAPLFSFLSAPFAFNEFLFILFPLAIVTLFIPWIIFKKTKSYWSLAIYFSSSFVLNIMFASIFAQALLSLFFVMLLYTDKPGPWDVGIILFASAAHSKALWVLLPVLLLKFFPLFFNKDFDIKKYFSFAVLAEQKLSFSSFFKLGPLINWFYSLQFNPIRQLLIIYFLFSGIVIDFRAMLFIPLLWALWLPEILTKKEKNVKNLVLLNYLFYIGFQIVVWFQDILIVSGTLFR